MFPRMEAETSSSKVCLRLMQLGSLLDRILLLSRTRYGRFYIKMTDRSGMPVPARKFNFTEEIDEPKKEDQPISREEFNSLFKMVSEIKEAL